MMKPESRAAFIASEAGAESTANPSLPKKRISIAVTNRKGGVGKSTTAFVLCCMLAMIKKYRILAVDLDPEGHLTDLAGFDVSSVEKGVPDFMLKGFFPDAVLSSKSGFDLIPASPETFEASAIENKDPQLLSLLFKSNILEKTDHEIVIVDVPGTATTLSNLATLSVDKSLLVFEPNQLNVKSLINTYTGIVSYSRKFRSDTAATFDSLFLGALPSRYDQRMGHQKAEYPRIVEMLEKANIKVYPPVTNRVAYAEIANVKGLGPLYKDKEVLLAPYVEILRDIDLLLRG